HCDLNRWTAPEPIHGIGSPWQSTQPTEMLARRISSATRLRQCWFKNSANDFCSQAPSFRFQRTLRNRLFAFDLSSGLINLMLRQLASVSHSRSPGLRSLRTTHLLGLE